MLYKILGADHNLLWLMSLQDDLENRYGVKTMCRH